MLIYKIIPSPLGDLTLLTNGKSIVSLYTDDEDKPLKNLAQLNNDHPLHKKAQKQLNEYFLGKRKKFELPLAPKGTDFQQRVWNALLHIPYGALWSYKTQAASLNSPLGQRAVGAANGKNPIPIIIPCHRVINTNRKLNGFSGGIAMKIFLLELEGHEVDRKRLRLLNDFI